jgi:hypothetical protein
MNENGMTTHQSPTCNIRGKDLREMELRQIDRMVSLGCMAARQSHLAAGFWRAYPVYFAGGC